MFDRRRAAYVAGLFTVFFACAGFVAQRTWHRPTDERATPDYRSPGDRPAVTISDDWTHRELAEYLKTRGVKVVIEAVPPIATPGRVAAWFVDEAADGKPKILVFLARDARDAREQAGSLGEGWFSKGRFAFGVPHNRAEPAQTLLLDRVRAAVE